MTPGGWIAIAILVVAAAGLATALARTRRALSEERDHSRILAAGLRESGDGRSLRAQLEALTALGESAYNALLLVDHTLAVIHMNAAARDLFAQGRPAPRGSVIAVTRQYEIDSLISRTLAGPGDEIDQPITIQGRPYRARALALATTQGKIVALALEDVSEIQRLGRARRDMVANISHELRTPITNIRLLAETLLGGAAADKTRRQTLLAKVAAETDVLEQMARELLDLAMIESGRAEIMLVPTKLQAISQEAAGRLAEQAARKSITVEDRTPPTLTVLADAGQIGRVLTNLLHNAIKFTPQGGRVTISAEPGGEWATISVTDSGPGIPPAERERVFERFYRGDRARGRGGTGLGLAIARHIVAGHGGTIRAEEAPGGHGARLSFTLPLAE